jgi:hypothetical protein
LLAILASADVEEIVGRGVENVSHADRSHLELVTAQGRPPSEHRDVPAVCVDVEVFRVEVADADPHALRSSQ